MAVITIAENAQFGDLSTQRLGPYTNDAGHLIVIAVDKAALNVCAWRSNDQGYTWAETTGPGGLPPASASARARTVAVSQCGDLLWCVFPRGSEITLCAASYNMETDTWSEAYEGGPSFNPESRPDAIGVGQRIGDFAYRFYAEALSDGSLVVVYSSAPWMTYNGDHHQWWSFSRVSLTTFAVDVDGKENGWGSRVLIMPAEASNYWGAAAAGTVRGEDDIVHIFFEQQFEEPYVSRIPENPDAVILLHGAWNSGTFAGPTELLNPFAPANIASNCIGMPGRRAKQSGGKEIARVALPLHGANANHYGRDVFHTPFSSSSFAQQQITAAVGGAQFGCFELDDGAFAVLVTPTFYNPDPDGLRLEVWRAEDGDFARQPDTITVPLDYYNRAIARGANNAVYVIIGAADSGTNPENSYDAPLRFITLGGAPADIVGVNGIPSEEAFGQTSGVRGGEDQRCEAPGVPSVSEGDCGPAGPIEPPDRELHPRCAYAMAL